MLEVVWALLYSGREQDAWQSRAEMWPRTDADRIRSEILRVRGQGIHSHVNASSAGPHGKKEHAQVFNAVSRAAGNSLEVTPPQAILLEFPPSSDQNADVGEQLLDLVIDAAGKVVSAHPAGATKSISQRRSRQPRPGSSFPRSGTRARWPAASGSPSLRSNRAKFLGSLQLRFRPAFRETPALRSPAYLWQDECPRRTRRALCRLSPSRQCL